MGKGFGKTLGCCFVVLAFALACGLAACGAAASGADAPAPTSSAAVPTNALELTHARQFAVERHADGTSLLTIGDGDRYLLVPEGVEAPEVGTDVTVIRAPVHDVYLAASSAMDFFRQLGALDAVSMTSTKRDDWSLPEASAALDAGTLSYVGKYSAPDYEFVLGQGADLAIESTMIYHAPEVAERLRSFGIPVLVERSSYEADPLGRLEWVKLYGLLTGRLDEASAFFEGQVAQVEAVRAAASDEAPRVAFFSISSGGHVVVRRPGDYVSQMIEMAGGRYFLDAEDAEDDSSLSTMKMEMEAFFEAASEADILIYNSAIEGEIGSIDELVAKNSRLADLPAVRSGQVWCTAKDFFQQPTCVAEMVRELAAVFSGNAAADQDFLYQVRWEA